MCSVRSHTSRKGISKDDDNLPESIDKDIAIPNKNL